MKTKNQIIAELQELHSTLQIGDDTRGYTKLNSTEYEATINAWADATIAKQAAELETEQDRQIKISAYAKLGLTPAEIEALLPNPAAPIS